MSDEVIEQDNLTAVSEQVEVEHQEEQQETKMVPLAALQAERRKRQDLEARAQVYEELMRSKQAESVQEEEDEDPNGLVEKQHLKQINAHTKREILEAVYQDNNPDAVRQINKYLKPILEKKPWLANSVDTAQNRYARAYEIVQDYLHLVEEKPVVRQSSNQDGRRIIENAQKPRSPVEVGKSARPEGVEYLKSIQGKKEFRDYRQKVLRGEG